MLLLQTMQNIKSLECPVTVELLSVVTIDVEWIPPPLHSPPLTPYPSLYDVSIACPLNQKQHSMFILAGRTLLKSYNCNSSMDVDVEPLYAWLGGNGRTRKNRVIHALLTLASSWQQSSAVMVVTQMRIVTINVEGQTIHAMFYFSLNNKPRSVQSTAKEIEMFDGLHLLIIEEMSTQAQVFLGSIDSCLRQLKEHHGISMGRVYIFYCGD
jgi:hypothetical protein